MRTLRPLADRVLVLPEAEAPKTTGLAVPKTQAEEPTEGVVVACGPGAELNTIAGYANPGLRIGDRVQFAKYAGRKTMHMGREHRLMRLEEIEGVIEDKEA